jgi:hypothetical protein
MDPYLGRIVTNERAAEPVEQLAHAGLSRRARLA